MHAFSESIANLLPLRTEGPFEYWLTRTKLLTIEDIPATIGEHLGTLHAGQLPKALRGLHRAAATFPSGSASPPALK